MKILLNRLTPPTKDSRNMALLLSLWSIAGSAGAAWRGLRDGRRDNDRIALLHGLASALVTVTAAAMFIQERRKNKS